MTDHTAEAEWRRLAAATSTSDAFADCVEGFAALPVDGLSWLIDLAIPDGWRAALAPDHRMRVTVYGERPNGGWEACETISVFEYTGTIPADVVSDKTERILRDLGAVGIVTNAVRTPHPAHLVCVRSEGHITLAGRRLWLGLSISIAASDTPRQGRLLQHAVFVSDRSLFRLGADIGTLTEAARTAFSATVGAAADRTQPADSASSVAEPPDLAASTTNTAAKDPELTTSRTTTLTDSERHFILKAMDEWRGAATGKPLPIEALGIAATWTEFDGVIERLSYAVKRHEELSDKDWSLILYLTEQGWASALVGAGLDFTTVSGIEDEDAVKLLRSIQWKLVVSGRASGQSLFPNAGRAVKPFDDES